MIETAAEIVSVNLVKLPPEKPPCTDPDKILDVSKLAYWMDPEGDDKSQLRLFWGILNVLGFYTPKNAEIASTEEIVELLPVAQMNMRRQEISFD